MIETAYQAYLRHWPAQSTFGPKHVGTLAAWYAAGELIVNPISAGTLYAFRHTTVRHDRWLTMFANGDAPLAIRRKGDVIISALLVTHRKLQRLVVREIETMTCAAPAWLFVLPRDPHQVAVARNLQAVRVGSRFTFDADVIDVYYLEPKHPLPSETLSARMCPIDAIERLTLVALPISLSFDSQDRCETALTECLSAKVSDPRQFESIAERTTIQLPSSTVVEAVALMRIPSRYIRNVPEAKRHCVQSTEPRGLDNRILRIDVPLRTSDAATVTFWSDGDVEHRYHLDRGRYYYVDERRPHRFINEGPGELIHLQMYCRSNPALRASLVAGRSVVSEPLPDA